MKIMISTTHSAFLFPGQGAYQPGALLAAARLSAVVEDTLRDVDRVADAHFGTSVRELLLDPAAPGLATLLERDPDTLQLAIYAASVATHRLLEERGVRPSILIGHSFGEIAALVCGGAFSVRDGAQIVAQRCLALKPAAGRGYMAAVSASADRCAAIIQMLASPEIAIAVENGPSQTVISGTAAAMDRMLGLAQTLGVSCMRLASAYPFHSAQLEHAAQTFRSALATLVRQPLRLPVYSPILERAYTDQDDLAAALASHLTRPVRFAAAIKRPDNVWAGSSMIFVEMGASNALSKQVRQILGDSTLPVFAPLASTDLEATVQALQSAVPAIASRDQNVLSVPLEQARDAGELAQFWQAHGGQIVAELNERLVAFRRGVEAAVPQDKPIAHAIATVTENAAHPVRSKLTPALSREKLQQDIVQLFAQAMEYPPEVFTEDVALEAELGIDSVKQMELLGKLEQQFQLPARPEEFRLSEYGTLRKITDFVHSAIGAEHAENALTAPVPPPTEPIPIPARKPAAVAHPAKPAILTRDALQEQIVAMFAEAMEYPPEVFTEDVALEAELGIDSVKQMELLSKLETRYQLPSRPETFRLSDYDTLRKVTDFVYDAIALCISERVQRMPVYAVG